MNTERIIFTGMQTLIDQIFLPDQAVIVEKSVIKAIVPVEMYKHHFPAKHYALSKEDMLVPGLIDLHIHGANGADVMDGTKKALLNISQSLAKEGVTGFLATTMTASNEKIEKILQVIVESKQDQPGAEILGVHLEGPFISKDKLGAQGNALQLPDAKLIEHWQTLAEGAIKIVTLAPELPGAVDCIRTLKSLGIITSIGHTNATYAETQAAIEAGCSQATHLFNAMRGIHQREPGVISALLLAENVLVELIVDNHHLHPAVIELILRLKGRSRLLLVTDAMRAKCLSDGEYTLSEQSVKVKKGRATLADGTLAGSTLRMPDAIFNMMEFTKCSLAEAVGMATANPASVLKLSDQKGSIAVGKDADLVVMDKMLNVTMTMRAGNIIYGD